MCRSIKVLRRAGQVVTEEELHAAALQFVRKISGFPKPSKANQAAFDRGVIEVAAASRRLLNTLESPPENRVGRLKPVPPNGGARGI
jgi:hypothetical protein